VEPILFIIGLLFLSVAATEDFLTREVADTLSLGLLLFALAYGFGESLLTGNWHPALGMLVGFGAMLALALILSLTGQWGDADSKLLLGIGALLGIGWQWWELPAFLLLLLFVGAAYGIGYTLVLAARHRKVFRKEFTTLLRKPRIHRLRLLVIALCFLLVALALFLQGEVRWFFVFFLVLLYSLFYLWIIVKTVENAILLKRYPVGKLTEGDWVQEKVVVKGRTIYTPGGRGITDEQIARLRRAKVRRVLVKEGIPFVPSFLFAWLLLGLFGHALLAFF